MTIKAGQRFGRLVAVRPTEGRYGDGKIVWEFRCDCGEVVGLPNHNVVNGQTKSCGCLGKGRFSRWAHENNDRLFKAPYEEGYWDK